jgi:hypothetical protein
MLLAVAMLGVLLGATCTSAPPFQRSGELADAAAANLAELLADGKTKLAELAAVPDVRDGDAAACYSSVRTRVPPLGPYTSFGRADVNGKLYCISEPDSRDIDISDRLYFQRAMSSGDFAVGVYQIGRATFMESIGFGYPVRKDAQIDGIVLAPVDLDKLSERLDAAVELPGNGELVVIDSAGTVVSELPDPDRWTGTPGAEMALVQQMLTADSGDATLAGVDGTTRSYSWRTVAGSAGNLRVAVGVPG